MRLAGKVAVITGASEGIGAACAESFRKRGASLILAARSGDKLARIAGPGDRAIAVDLALESGRRELIESALKQFGRIDILVNNAGVGLYRRSWESTTGELRYLFELNFFAPLELARAIVPGMLQRGSGTIVNVTSVAARVPLPWFPMYSASKAALESMSACLRMEAPQLHVMTVCPGYVDTAFQANVMAGSPPEALRRARSRTAVSAAECAEAIAKGMDRGARTVYIPWWTRWAALAYAVAPGVVESRLERLLAGKAGGDSQ